MALTYDESIRKMRELMANPAAMQRPASYDDEINTKVNTKVVTKREVFVCTPCAHAFEQYAGWKKSLLFDPNFKIISEVVTSEPAYKVTVEYTCTEKSW